MLAVEDLAIAADERSQIAERRVGQLVRDRWRLDSLLGVGGMAAVYAATHRNGSRAAVKILHPELSASPEMKQRFIDEGYVANCVKHRGAVSVIDDGTTQEGEIFLVMELLEGENLEQHLIVCGTLSSSAVLRISDRLLDVLAAAHDEGIVHRDVKPDNIFLTREGGVRLLDFGIARINTPGRCHTTQWGTAIGTPAFMPPEQARGRWEQLDGRTDLWAVGATMFVLLTGKHVREADTVNEELLAAMTLPAPSLRVFAPHLPKPLIDLVDKALAFERADRWSSAREMQAAVQSVEALLASERSAPTCSETAPVPPASPTLVTPSLEPAAGSTPRAQKGMAQRSLIVGVSAVASFLALVAWKELSKTVGATPASATPEISIEPVGALAATAAQDAEEQSDSSETGVVIPASRELSPERPALGPIRRSGSARPAAKTNSEKRRPSPTVVPLSEETDVLAAARSPLVAPSAERRAPAATDPLDRRK